MSGGIPDASCFQVGLSVNTVWFDCGGMCCLECGHRLLDIRLDRLSVLDFQPQDDGLAKPPCGEYEVLLVRAQREVAARPVAWRSGCFAEDERPASARRVGGVDLAFMDDQGRDRPVMEFSADGQDCLFRFGK